MYTAKDILAVKLSVQQFLDDEELPVQKPSLSTHPSDSNPDGAEMISLPRNTLDYSPVGFSQALAK